MKNKFVKLAAFILVTCLAGSMLIVPAFAEGNQGADYVISVDDSIFGYGDSLVITCGDSSIKYTIGQTALADLSVNDTRAYAGDIHAIVGRDDVLVTVEDPGCSALSLKSSLPNNDIDITKDGSSVVFKGNKQEIPTDGELSLEGDYYKITVSKDGSIVVDAKTCESHLTLGIDNGTGIPVSVNARRLVRNYISQTLDLDVKGDDAFDVWNYVPLPIGTRVSEKNLPWSYVKYSTCEGNLFFNPTKYLKGSNTVNTHTFTLDSDGGLVALGSWCQGFTIEDLVGREINGESFPWSNNTEGDYGKFWVSGDGRWLYTAEADGKDAYRFTTSFRNSTLTAIVGREPVPEQDESGGDTLTLSAFNDRQYTQTVQRLTDDNTPATGEVTVRLHIY